MATTPSKTTNISTVAKSDPKPPPRSTTATGKIPSSTEAIVSTQTPVLTDAVQKCVDTAVEATATNQNVRLYFMQGVMKKMMREIYKES